MDFQFPNEWGFMEGIDAFPPYVYRTKFNFEFKEFKNKVDRYLKDANSIASTNKFNDPEDGDATTGVYFNNKQWKNCQTDCSYDWNPPHKWKEFEKFVEFVSYVSPFLLSQWYGLQHQENSIFASWVNVHNHGGWTTPHQHANTQIAVVGYLDVPENSGNLLIENPLKPYLSAGPLSSNYSFWSPIEVETGDVLFFPGWLWHQTEKNMSDQSRYVLSANVSLVNGPVPIY